MIAHQCGGGAQCLPCGYRTSACFDILVQIGAGLENRAVLQDGSGLDEAVGGCRDGRRGGRGSSEDRVFADNRICRQYGSRLHHHGAVREEGLYTC